jgi:hypothetical protein
MMSLIQCDADCIYQKDGYCSLDAPTAIHNDTGKGCVHCIKTASHEQKARPAAPQRPQTPPAQF